MKTLAHDDLVKISADTSSGIFMYSSVLAKTAWWGCKTNPLSSEQLAIVPLTFALVLP